MSPCISWQRSKWASMWMIPKSSSTARLTPRWTGIVTEWSPPIMVKNFPAFTA
jgi:hypothetical protein